MSPQIVGSLILALPCLLIAWLALWRRTRPVFWFAVVLICLAVAYLNLTGAARDIGQRFLPASVPQPVPAR